VIACIHGFEWRSVRLLAAADTGAWADLNRLWVLEVIGANLRRSAPRLSFELGGRPGSTATVLDTGFTGIQGAAER
jgi:hypothetical protein